MTAPASSGRAGRRAGAAGGAAARALVLLGPQRRRAVLDRVIDDLDAGGRVAVVNAGWRERETEDGELLAAAGGGSVNLSLYARADRIFRADPELAEAHRGRQDTLRQLRRVYDARLAHGMAAWREVATLPVADAVREAGDRAALEALRFLDEWHLELIEREMVEFETRYAPAERPAVVTERAELRDLFTEATCLAVAGGHVAVLLNRLRLLGVGALLDERPELPVVAWSAGAMALGERIVLFHDSPPQGPGNPEVFARGLGRYAGTLVFPYGSSRLRIDDPGRVGRLARRFGPDACVLLDEEARIDRGPGGWSSPGGALHLTVAGSVDSREKW